MMGKYYMISYLTKKLYGPYSTYKEANDLRTNKTMEAVLKECPEENELGAPNVYPFNTEEYNDGEEG